MIYRLDLFELLGYHFSVRDIPIDVPDQNTSATILPTPIRLKGDMHEHGHCNHG